MTEQEILVYADWVADRLPTLVGRIYISRVKRRELTAFEYDAAWLAASAIRDLDPDLRLFRGRQYPRSELPSFGLFSDSAPDRWGRMLMRRREAIDAKREKRQEKVLEESDYLLGVHDLGRMGGLRFKTEASGNFLAADGGLATPPWTRLRELEAAARELSRPDEDESTERWLDLLLAPGSSLGGARPKATVVDADGRLWIAKFPAHNDNIDTGAWEKCVHDLAAKAGLVVPDASLENISDGGSTFLVKRFDRRADGSRIHFASALALLGKADGADAADGASYLELVEWIRGNGSKPNVDLPELWKRIAFNIAVSNTDDHLRNHGFLLLSSGWRLSPLYDVNPNPAGRGLSLNISETDNSLDFALVLKQAPRFFLDAMAAQYHLAKILDAVADWEPTAAATGLTRASIQRMRPAFRFTR